MKLNFTLNNCFNNGNPLTNKKTKLSLSSCSSAYGKWETVNIIKTSSCICHICNILYSLGKSLSLEFKS